MNNILNKTFKFVTTSSFTKRYMVAAGASTNLHQEQDLKYN